MGMVVQHNMNALNAYNKLNTNVAGLKKSSEKLASGYRINRAGDDAAGLAISEKMRSQIKGLNQAVRNSQDGINMIQTYEGAAQESHNILRRMKELASEAANGTYQNEVDRDAVQLEFNQLNDELNQIADTDFNGVVMLNGGQMADGTLAVNNKFDYAKGDAVAPSKLSKNDVNVLDGQAFDDASVADAFWTSLNSQWDRTDTDASNDGPESVDITFKFDKASGSWSAISANNGANYKNVTVQDNGNGGFSVTMETPTYTWTDKDGNDHTVMSDTTFYENANDGTTIDKAAYDALGAVAKGDYKAITPTAGDPLVAELANVVIDESVLANGDTITLTFNNPITGVDAPDNIGADVSDASGFTAVIGAEKATDLNLTTEIKTGLNDDAMNTDLKQLINLMDGADVTVNYGATDNGDTTAAATYDMTITLKDGTIIKGKTDGDTTDFSVNGSTFTFKWTNDGTDLKMDILSGTTELMTITPATMDGVAGTNAAGDDVTTFSTGNIKFKLGTESYKYDEGAVPTVEVAKTGNVSKANSNKAANAPLTYTDHLVLQTGARTKDSVDFTMEYSTDGMGDLKANLNISSRADGLNTAGLSLNTQESANYAIDRIDNAINKVSMVRATFGATQNRLEHKIDNLTTTAENIQEAESSIRDTDMASEMMNYTKFNILQQAAQSMLAQANQQPQSILQLLG